MEFISLCNISPGFRACENINILSHSWNNLQFNVSSIYMYMHFIISKLKDFYMMIWKVTRNAKYSLLKENNLLFPLLKRWKVQWPISNHLDLLQEDFIGRKIFLLCSSSLSLFCGFCGRNLVALVKKLPIVLVCHNSYFAADFRPTFSGKVAIRRKTRSYSTTVKCTIKMYGRSNQSRICVNAIISQLRATYQNHNSHPRRTNTKGSIKSYFVPFAVLPGH